MALTQCLQCSGMFDESVQFCPGCGFQVPIQAPKVVSQKTNSEHAAANESVEQTANPRLEPTNANNLIVAFSIFVGMVVFGLYLNGTNSSHQVTEVEDGKAMAITMAQAFVKERLKSPSSASFRWSFDEYRVIKGIGGEWSVTGYVDAVTSFNANLRTHWMVKMCDEGSNWRLLSINIPE